MSVMSPANSVFMPSVISKLNTSRSARRGWNSNSVLRASTDAYFYADVTINYAIIGSRYWLVNNADHSQVLATGTISSDPQVLTNIPSYGSPMIMLLRLRNASGSSKYKTWQGLVPHARSGASFYTAQQLDE